MGGSSDAWPGGVEPSYGYAPMRTGRAAPAGGPYACPSDDEVERALEEEAAMEMSAECRQELTEAMPLPKR